MVKLLRRRSVEDTAAQVREKALRLLVAGWSDDPATAELLQRRAVEDPDPHVRIGVLRLLAEYKRPLVTARLLRWRIVEDPDTLVRDTALRVLVEYFSDDPATADLLRRQSLKDTNPALRPPAMGRIALHLETGLRSTVLTHDLDGAAPGIDPLQPIDRARLEATAAKLNIGLDEARRLYEGVAADYGLTLAFD